jgi:hypothetical protein
MQDAEDGKYLNEPSVRTLINPRDVLPPEPFLYADRRVRPRRARSGLMACSAQGLGAKQVTHPDGHHEVLTLCEITRAQVMLRADPGAPRGECVGSHRAERTPKPARVIECQRLHAGRTPHLAPAGRTVQSSCRVGFGEVCGASMIQLTEPVSLRP